MSKNVVLNKHLLLIQSHKQTEQKNTPLNRLTKLAITSKVGHHCRHALVILVLVLAASSSTGLFLRRLCARHAGLRNKGAVRTCAMSGDNCVAKRSELGKHLVVTRRWRMVGIEKCVHAAGRRLQRVLGQVKRRSCMRCFRCAFNPCDGNGASLCLRRRRGKRALGATHHCGNHS